MNQLLFNSIVEKYVLYSISFFFLKLFVNTNAMIFLILQMSVTLADKLKTKESLL